MGLAFLSYRRDDVGAAAQAIYAQMKVHFGSGQLFMDLNSITPGTTWPAHLRQRVKDATGVLVLIGERWLRVSDQWGRRRIDLPGDWVASEIQMALEAGKPIIPVLIGDAVDAPPEDALPPGISRLASKGAKRLRPSEWVSDLAVLIAVVEKEFGLIERADLRGIVGPHPNARKAKLPRVDQTVLNQSLAENPGWEPWEDGLPREYPYVREELRKSFTFGSFIAAAEFMRLASDFFEREKHHPRWSNEWRLVTVGLTTWDAKNKITQRDLEVAKGLDALYSSR